MEDVLFAPEGTVLFLVDPAPGWYQRSGGEWWPCEPPPLDLARTRAALERHDALLAAYRARTVPEIMAMEAGPLAAELDGIEEAERAVGEAFAEDTADRNDPADARRILPSDWLRALVAKYGSR